MSILIDSDVLIWLLRGNAHAAAVVGALDKWAISAVTYMELAQGCRNKAELKALQKVFQSTDAEVLPISAEISELACTLVEKYSLSQSVYLADALIAATAIEHAMPLLTGNAKHFKVIDRLDVKTYKAQSTPA
jgi:predicted nucleic acid-binding protein